MKDAIDILLSDKQHPDARSLLAFHHANPDFLTSIVAEIRWLKQAGRKAAGVKALVHFVRWFRDWRSVDGFGINDHWAALASRICTLLWPDINGMVQFRHCAADDILDTRIVRRRNKYGSLLEPGANTLPHGYSFLPREESGAGFVRPIRWGAFPTITTLPPDVPALDRPATFHELITESDAASIVEPLRRIAANAPNPDNVQLRAWVHHVETQPEIFAFMESTLRQRQPLCFSAKSLLEYTRWSIRRVAVSHKRFTLPGQFDGLYCRALIARNPEFNGRCEFREGGKSGLANRLLGCYLAVEPKPGEPYRRSVWPLHR